MGSLWHLPLEGKPNKEEIGNVLFNKNRARKICREYGGFTDYSCVVPDCQSEWKMLVQHVTAAFRKAREHGKYTEMWI